MESTNLLIIFLTGLTTGGLTCLALQGGLLASVIASSPSSRARPALPRGRSRDLTPPKLIPVVSFLTAKLAVHTILGFFLGLLGSAITLSPITRGWLQVFIGIYLFGIAGNLLNLHPLFRYFVITPPKFLARLAKSQSRSQSIFAPAILGLLTVFLPCATTQAMEVVAVGTGNPLYGAAIMFSFVLGTSPTFLIFGLLLNHGAGWFRKYFPAIAATAMFIMSIYSINSGAGLMGSVYTIQNFWEVATSTPHQTNLAIQGKNIQSATITAFDTGYSPKSITLKKGVPAQITIKTDKVSSCARAFSIPILNIEKVLPSTGEALIEFTPTELGPLAFSCSMGMYTGKFNVVN